MDANDFSPGPTYPRTPNNSIDSTYSSPGSLSPATTPPPGRATDPGHFNTSTEVFTPINNPRTVVRSASAQVPQPEQLIPGARRATTNPPSLRRVSGNLSLRSSASFAAQEPSRSTTSADQQAAMHTMTQAVDDPTTLPQETNINTMRRAAEETASITTQESATTTESIDAADDGGVPLPLIPQYETHGILMGEGATNIETSLAVDDDGVLLPTVLQHQARRLLMGESATTTQIPVTVHDGGVPLPLFPEHETNGILTSESDATIAGPSQASTGVGESWSFPSTIPRVETPAIAGARDNHPTTVTTDRQGSPAQATLPIHNARMRALRPRAEPETDVGRLPTGVEVPLQPYLDAINALDEDDGPAPPGYGAATDRVFGEGGLGNLPNDDENVIAMRQAMETAGLVLLDVDHLDIHHDRMQRGNDYARRARGNIHLLQDGAVNSFRGVYNALDIERNLHHEAARRVETAEAQVNVLQNQQDQLITVNADLRARLRHFELGYFTQADIIQDLRDRVHTAQNEATEARGRMMTIATGLRNVRTAFGLVQDQAAAGVRRGSGRHLENMAGVGGIGGAGGAANSGRGRGRGRAN